MNSEGKKIDVGIVPEQFKGMVPFTRKYETILRANDISVEWISTALKDFGQACTKLTHLICRISHEYNDVQCGATLLDVAENEYGLSVFPNAATRWSFDDKIRQAYQFDAHDFPHPKCWVFWNKQHAKTWMDTVDLPVVFKLRGGAGSSNVVLIRNRRQGHKLIGKMFWKGLMPGSVPGGTQWIDFSIKKKIRMHGGRLIRAWKADWTLPNIVRHKDYALFQEFLPDNQFDTRVMVIGDRAFGYKRINRKNDFRSSGSGIKDYNPDNVNMVCIRTAFDVSRKLGFQSMTYDFLLNRDRKPVICECCYATNDTGIFACKGYWDEELNWHEGHYWPQYLQLVDLLDRPDLVQPEMTP